MAFCPKCKSEMPASATSCPGCGFDFPDIRPDDRFRKTGIEYSPFADLSLILGAYAAALACCGTIYMMLAKFVSGDYFSAFVVGPTAFFLFFGVLVVFLRVQK